MQNNNQRTSAARHGRNVPHDEKQVTLSQGVAKHEKNESNYSSTTQATKPNPFKRTLDNEELYERQAAKKKNKHISDSTQKPTEEEGSDIEKNFSLYGEFFEFCQDDSAQQQTEKEGSDDGNFDNSKDTFVVNLFKQNNDGKDRALESEDKEFDSEDERNIINNLAKEYGEDNIFENSDKEAITGSFCYEDGPICPY